VKKIALIANKNAGKGKAVASVQAAKRILWGYQIDFFNPPTLDTFQNTCSSLSPAIYEAAVVLGGDGTVNRALRAFVHKEIPLCAFPAGTANDLSSELGVKGDWEQVQRLLDRKSIESVDLVAVNGIPFATVAGMGVGATLTSEFNQRRDDSIVFRQIVKRLKFQVYTALSAKTILFGRGFIHHVHIKSTVFNEKLRTAAIFICNQGQLAGNLKVASTAENRDEKFSVLILPGTRTLPLLSALVKLKQGTLSVKDSILFSTDQLTIRDLNGKNIRVFGDGETLVEDSRLHFKILPHALKVYREKGMA
jgi:diacylglycerol kinase (ATP)